MWLVWSLGFTVALSAVTSWGLLRLWRDDEESDRIEDAEGRVEGEA